jgi:hypothetical protein
MKREILDILIAFESKQITIIAAHQKICDIKLQSVDDGNEEEDSLNTKS